MNRCEKAALEYAKMGYSVIPIGDNKRPLLEWREFQTYIASEPQIRAWFKRWNTVNVGIVTGHVSGLVVLDMDNQEAREFVKRKGVPATPCVITSKGAHLYFYMPKDVEWNNRSFQDLGLDIRGEGGYVVAPPSLHPSGVNYTWSGWHLWNMHLADVPEWMFEYLEESREGGLKERGWQNSLLAGVSSGGRNHATASLAGRLLTKGLTGDEVLEILLMWNETRNKPPLSDYEVERTVDSIVARHKRRN